MLAILTYVIVVLHKSWMDDGVDYGNDKAVLVVVAVVFVSIMQGEGGGEAHRIVQIAKGGAEEKMRCIKMGIQQTLFSFLNKQYF